VVKKLVVFLTLMTVLAFIIASCGGPPPPPPPEPEPDTTAMMPDTTPPEPPPPPPPPPIQLTTIYFDFDKYSLTSEAQAIMAQNAAELANPDYENVRIRIEGNCDERGSDEYNMALGEKRAATARDYLVNYGIAPDRMTIISYGESRPVDPRHNEEAWAKNRRDDFVKVSE
jgi:peptidoglycan-associated lipoprotein